jgi:hypothetical protein
MGSETRLRPAPASKFPDFLSARSPASEDNPATASVPTDSFRNSQRFTRKLPYRMPRRRAIILRKNDGAGRDECRVLAKNSNDTLLSLSAAVRSLPQSMEWKSIFSPAPEYAYWRGNCRRSSGARQ